MNIAARSFSQKLPKPTVKSQERSPVREDEEVSYFDYEAEVARLLVEKRQPRDLLPMGSQGSHRFSKVANPLEPSDPIPPLRGCTQGPRSNVLRSQPRVIPKTSSEVFDWEKKNPEEKASLILQRVQ